MSRRGASFPMWVWVVGVLTSGCAEAPSLEPEADERVALRSALVGTWAQVHTGDRGSRAEESWSFGEDGVARYESIDEWGRRFEECRWRVGAGALRVTCADYWQEIPVVLHGRDVVFAPLVRVADELVENRDVLAEWKSQVIGHGLGIDNPLVVEPDSPPPIAGGSFAVTEEVVVRLHADYRLGIVRTHSGSCTSTVTLSRQRCALDDDGALACRNEAFRPDDLDPDERRAYERDVHVYPFDRETGEPLLAGLSLSDERWQRED